MTQAFSLPRRLLIYSLSLVLAVVPGFLLATPKDFSSFVLVAMLFFALATPLLMRRHSWLGETTNNVLTGTMRGSQRAAIFHI